MRATEAERPSHQWVPGVMLRRRLFAGALILSLSVCATAWAPPRAEATTWKVELFVALDSGAQFAYAFSVALADPAGSATVFAGGIPFFVSQTATDFSLNVYTALTVWDCRITIAAWGMDPHVDPTNPETYALAFFQGTLTRSCPAAAPVSLLIRGSFTARIVGPVAIVESVTGQVEMLQPEFERSESLVADTRLACPFVVRTDSTGEATIRQPDGSLLIVGPDTTVAYDARFSSWSTDLDIEISLVEGVLDHRVAPATGTRQYTVVAPTGVVTVTGTEFSTRYGQAGTDGTLLVSVGQGTVQVADRRAQLRSVVAGGEAAFEDSVPRVTLILPVNLDSILGGRLNTFSWTGFPGAAGYLIEFTTSPAGFARPNSPAPESHASTIPVRPGSFTERGGEVSFPLMVPADVVSKGTRVSLRVFPTDAAGQVLAGSTASDTATITVREPL